MSRHRERADLFWSNEEFFDKAEMKQRLSRDRSKDVTLDYFNRNIERAEQSETTKWITQDKTTDELLQEFDTLCRKGDDMIAKGQEKGKEKESVYIVEFDDLERKLEQGSKGHNALAAITGQQEKCSLQTFQKQFEQEHAQLAARAREEFMEITSPQKRKTSVLEQRQVTKVLDAIEPSQARAMKLIEKYYEVEKKYHKADEMGNGHERGMANIERHHYAEEICRDDDAMKYLQKNDIQLFKEMDTMREQERVRELEKSLELEL